MSIIDFKTRTGIDAEGSNTSNVKGLLEEAIADDLCNVVVLGRTKAGTLYIAMTYSILSEVNLDLDRLKGLLVHGIAPGDMVG